MKWSWKPSRPQHFSTTPFLSSTFHPVSVHANKATSDTMDTQSNETSTESEQSGSAVAEGRRREYDNEVSDLSPLLRLSHCSQRRRVSSVLNSTSSRRGDRSRSPLPDRVNTRLRHSNGAPPATEVSANLATRASREAKETPDSYFLEIASEIRDFDQRWTTLDDAPTPELHKLTVQVSALAKEYSVSPDKRTENEATYRSLCQLGQEETDRRSVMLKLIPTLKTEFVDFDGLVDALIGMGVMSLICTLADSDQSNKSTTQSLLKKSLLQSYPNLIHTRRAVPGTKCFPFLVSDQLHLYIASLMYIPKCADARLLIDKIVMHGSRQSSFRRRGPLAAPRLPSTQSGVRTATW
jgi:hypothetical protein